MSLNHITDESYPFPIPAWFYQINADEGGIVTDGLVDKKHPIETWLGTSPTGVAHWALCDTSGNYLSSIGMTGTQSGSSGADLIFKNWSSGSVTNTPLTISRSNGRCNFGATIAVNGLTADANIGVNNNLLTTSAGGASNAPGVTFFADNTSGMYYDSNGVVVGVSSAGASRISTNATGTIISNPLTLSTLTDNTHGNISSGSYTPTIANLAGVTVAGSSALLHYYNRTGNVVQVCGRVELESDNMANTAFSFTITLPFAMGGNFSNAEQCVGGGNAIDNSSQDNFTPCYCFATSGAQTITFSTGIFAAAPPVLANDIIIVYNLTYTVQ